MDNFSMLSNVLLYASKEPIKASEVAEVVIIGILLVFFILLLITLIMMVFPYIFGNKRRKVQHELVEEKQNDIQIINEKTECDDGELISVITAAVAAYRSSTGESSDISNFKVVAFKKSPRR